MLEARLREQWEKDVEVLNLSCPGLSLRQEIDLARYRGLRFRPDLIVFAYVYNDLIETPILDRPNMNEELANLLEKDDRRLLMQWTRWYDEDEPTFALLRAAFAKLGGFAREQRVMLAGFPRLSDDPASQAFLEPVRRLAAVNRIPYLDLLPRLPMGRLETLRIDPKDDVHLSVEAHQLYARALAFELLPRLEMLRRVTDDS